MGEGKPKGAESVKAQPGCRRIEPLVNPVFLFHRNRGRSGAGTQLNPQLETRNGSKTFCHKPGEDHPAGVKDEGGLDRSTGLVFVLFLPVFWDFLRPKP